MASKMSVKFVIPTLVFFAVLLLVGIDVTYYLPFAAALLHEVGHLCVMLICGQKVKQIIILPFGIDIKKVPCISSYKTDIAVSAAGIAVNALMIYLCMLFPKSLAVDFFMQSNIVLFAINVLPIKSLDGGQILEKILLLFMSPYTVERAMAICSMVCIILVGSVAIWVFFGSGYNFTLLFMCMYLFTGLFLKNEKA